MISRIKLILLYFQDMKKIIPILLIAFAPLLSKSQTYQYIPMGLDNSSFWVMDYYWGGQQSFNGERVCQIVGDTLILNKLYSKCNCYTSKGRNQTTALGNGALQFDRDYLLYEDTLQKKVLIYKTNLSLKVGELEFERNVGDSSNMYLNNYSLNQTHFIDSVKYDSYPGSLIRRTTYSNHQFGGEFKAIEGIGASHSFPEGHIGEWGIAMATCRCYSKGGNVQYLNGIPADSCYKKASQKANPIGVDKLVDLGVRISFWNNEISITMQEMVNMNIALFSINGKKLYSKIIKEGTFKKSFADFPTGIYILSLQSSKGIENRKILIR